MGGGFCVILFIMFVSGLVECLYELKFGILFVPLKVGYQSYQSNPKEFIDLQLVKNRFITSFSVAALTAMEK